LLDEEDYILSQHYWDEGEYSILNLFGTYMQHPEENFVLYFGSTPVAAFEQGSPRHSPRKTPEQGSPTHSPRNNPDVIGEQPEESQFNCTSETTVVGTPSLPNKPNGEEENVIASLVSPRHTESTIEDPQKPAEEITVHNLSNIQAHSNNPYP
jgi:hypothetical protein